MTKTSIKLKSRSSSVADREGTLYFQIIHDHKVRQLATSSERIGNDRERLNHIVADFEHKGLTFEADDIITEYHRIISEHTIFIFMEGVIAQLKQMGKTRTEETYRSALNSYRRFRNGEDIMLDDITSDEMVLYEASMANRGVCPNSTSFYMRILRATYNRAVEKGIVEQKNPFKHVYTGVGKTVKRAIGINDIKRIKQLDLTLQPSLAIARDIFMFSFYTRGMTFVDIAYLRKRDVSNGIITYRRHKTGQLLNIKVEKYAQEIIDRYNSPESDYIFPFIKTEGDEYHQYRNALRLINGKLKKIGNMIGIPIKLTTYVGRHSWGSAAKTSNIPISVISESMGHDNETTTQIYLASLDTSVIDQANAKILKKLQ